jgi:16S rRNA (uracil1498-N3)-methyltransferase
VKGFESRAICSIEEILPNFGESNRNVMLIQGLISQPSRWEFLLEKGTELGATVIQPVTTERTERNSFNRERSERILRAAVKQTKRSRIPELREISSLGDAVSGAISEGRRVILLHESVVAGFPSLHPQGSAGTAPLQNAFDGGEPIAIAVGPEGGFSDDEVTMALHCGAEIVSLGPRRLRAETAAIAALAILS